MAVHWVECTEVCVDADVPKFTCKMQKLEVSVGGPQKASTQCESVERREGKILHFIDEGGG